MAYTLYDANGNVISHHDLQDKGHWCADGETFEEAFVRKYGGNLGVRINPAKTTDRYAPDLLQSDSRLADLKLQSTPMFTSARYNIDSTYAVVFNVKDRLRYAKHYPDIDIYFWVDWKALRMEMRGVTYTANPLTGVFKVPFVVLDKYLENRPVHTYGQRIGDTKGNATGSYVCDIRAEIFTKVA